MNLRTLKRRHYALSSLRAWVSRAVQTNAVGDYTIFFDTLRVRRRLPGPYASVRFVGELRK
jgi:hypothetical protein